MRQKKFLLVPFGAVAIALVLTSAAYACTVFRGTLTVTGDRGGSVTATGLRTGMVNSVSSTKAYSSANSGWVKVSTGTDGCCNRLPQKDSTGALRSYQINFFNGEGFDTHGHWYNDCMTGDSGVTLANVHLNASGQIAQQLVGTSYTSVTQPVQVSLGNGLTANVGAQESAVCISDISGLYGNQAPVTIV